MKNKNFGLKKIILWIIAVLMICSVFLPLSYFYVSAEDNTTAMDLFLFDIAKDTPDAYDDDGTPIYRYNSGAMINAYAKFNVSGTDTDEKDVTVKIWIPKDGNNYIKSVEFSGSYNANRIIFSGDDDPHEFSVSYVFNRFRGGIKGGYPFAFKFENMLTPNGTRQPVYFSVYNSEGELLYGGQKKIIFESVASSAYEADKYININNLKSEEVILTNYEWDVANEDRWVQTPEDTTATFYNTFKSITPAGALSGQAEYRVDKFKVIDTIPEGSVFLAENATNQLYGWKLVPGTSRSYVAELDRSNSQLKDFFNATTLRVPIVLGFPQQPFSEGTSADKFTKWFTNTSEFYYYDTSIEDYVKIPSDTYRHSARVNFTTRTKPKPSATYTWNKKIVQGTSNFVSINDKDVHDSMIINGSSAAKTSINYFPMTPEQVFPTIPSTRPVWQSEYNILQKALKNYPTDDYKITRILDSNQNVRFDNRNRSFPYDARMYYKDFIVTASKVSDYDAEDSDTSVPYMNESAKFWVFKTFTIGKPVGGQWGFSTTTESTDVYQLIDNDAKISKSPYVLVPVTDHAIGFNELVNIDDEGGYYTGLYFIFNKNITEEEAEAIRRQSVVDPSVILNDDNSLKGMADTALHIRNANVNIKITHRLVKEGAKSVTENNTLFLAPAKYDFLSNFTDYVKTYLDAKDYESATQAYWRIGLFGNVEVNNATNKRTQDFESDTFYTFKGNFAKMALTASSSASYFYKESAPIHTGSFSGLMYDINAPTQAKNLKGIVLLPYGMEYLSTETYGSAKGEPVLIENYKNTGRQAMIYDFGDFGDVHSENVAQTQSIGTVTYKIKITNRTNDSATSKPPGHTVDTWLVWDNNITSIFPTNYSGFSGKIADDTLDLNNDEQDNSLLKATYDIFYYAPAELTMRKYVSTDANLNTWTEFAPFQDIGGDLYFKILFVNQYTDSVTELSTVDVLSRIDDYKLVSNEEGEYLKKGPALKRTGSEFPVYLKEKQKLSEVVDGEGNRVNNRFDFYYTTADRILSDFDVVEQASDWISENDLDEYLTASGKRYSDITAVRAVLKEGEIIKGISAQDRPKEGEDPIQYYQNNPQIGNTAVFYIPAYIPHDKSIARLSTAYNSSAYKEASANTYRYEMIPNIEANEVSFSNIYYSISGTVFRDYKRDGQISDNRLENITVQLVYAADTTIDGITYTAKTPVPDKYVDIGRYDADKNEVVPDTAGNQTVTDTEGNYYFVVYKRGKYDVLFTSNENDPLQSFVQYGASEGITRSNTIATNEVPIAVEDKIKTTYSTSLTLSPEHIRYTDDNVIDFMSTSLHEVRNAGIDDGKRDVSIYKYGVINESDPVGSGFPLQASFELISTNNEVLKGTTDSITGKLVFQDVSYGEYTLKETAAPEGTDLIDPIRILVGSNGLITILEDADNAFYNNDNGFIEIKNVPPKRVIQIVKTSALNASEKLEGVVFGLYQNNQAVVDRFGSAVTATTNSEGIATFTNLPTGVVYTVKEITPAKYYTSNHLKEDGTVVDLSTVGLDFTLQSNEENKVLNLNNVPYQSTIKVKKIEIDTSERKRLPNVVFGLYQDDVAVLDASKNPITATTGEDGIATFTNVPFGEYQVKEIQALTGYVLNTTVYTVKIAENDYTYWVPRMGGAVENQIIKGTIQFTKVDADTNNPLAGVMFNLYESIYENDEWVKRGSAIRQGVTSDENGIVTFENVPYGDYLIEETDTLTGYEQLTQLLHVAITSNGETVSVNESGKLKNSKIKANIQLTKIDKDEYEKASSNIVPIEGVVFAIYNAQLNTDGSYIAIGDALSQVTSNASGLVEFENMPYGHYIIKEVAAKEGYILDDTALHVQVAQSGTLLATSDGYYTNQIVKGNVIVEKRDDSNNVIEGVTFALSKDGVIKYEASTDASGNAQFNDVVYGDYVLSEVSAPAQYTLSTRQENVVIDTNGKTVSFTGDNKYINKQIKGQLTVVKKDFDTDEAIKGAVFTLYKTTTVNGNYVIADPLEKDGITQVQTTDADGRVIFTDIPYGVYIIKETAAPIGYVLNETEEIVMINTQDTSIEKTFTNKAITSTVVVEKVDKDTPTIKLAGVKFVLVQNDVEKYEAVTSQEGIAQFENVRYGTYILKEKETLENYVLSDTQMNVTVSNANEIIELGQFENQLIKGQVSVLKTDDNNRSIAKVVFTLSKDGVVKYESTTDESGVARFDDVLFGTYQLSEKFAPLGYEMSNRIETVVIDTHGKSVEFKGENRFINPRIKGSISVVKVDKTTRERLVDAHFGLYKATILLDGSYQIGEAYTINGRAYTVTTDELGTATFTDVPYGTYIVKELVAPEGYVLDETEQGVEITEKGQLVAIVHENDKITGTVRIEKVDKENPDKKLEGVTFALFENDEEKYVSVTNKDGIAVFEDVPYGNYVLKETETLADYVLSKDTRNVSVIETDQVIDLGQFENQMIKGNIQVQKVDGRNNSKPLSGVTFELRQDNQMILKSVSDRHGMVVFKDVPYGKYTVVEVETLPDYVLSQDVKEASITSYGQQIDLGKILNFKKDVPQSVDAVSSTDAIPNTSQQMHMSNYIIIIVIAIMNLFVLQKINNKNSSY